APVGRSASRRAEAGYSTNGRLQRKNHGSLGNTSGSCPPERDLHAQRKSRRLGLPPNLLSDYREQPHRDPGWLLSPRGIARSQTPRPRQGPRGISDAPRYLDPAKRLHRRSAGRPAQRGFWRQGNHGFGRQSDRRRQQRREGGNGGNNDRHGGWDRRPRHPDAKGHWYWCRNRRGGRARCRFAYPGSGGGTPARLHHGRRPRTRPIAGRQPDSIQQSRTISACLPASRAPAAAGTLSSCKRRGARLRQECGRGVSPRADRDACLRLPSRSCIAFRLFPSLQVFLFLIVTDCRKRLCVNASGSRTPSPHLVLWLSRCISLHGPGQPLEVIPMPCRLLMRLAILLLASSSVVTALSAQEAPTGASPGAWPPQQESANSIVATSNAAQVAVPT